MSDENKSVADRKAEAEAKARAEAEARAAAKATEGLVKVRKDGDVLHVHPTTVEAHRNAGWHPVKPVVDPDV